MENAIYNPNGKAESDLPIIYGFNNGGSPGFFSGVLIAADGKTLGGHLCSHECYMPGDLGVLDGYRPDRHEIFRAHYPGGYRMKFVGYADVDRDIGLKEAFRLNGLMAGEGSAQSAA